MSNYIEEKFYKELVEMSPLKGRDMHNRPPLYDTPDEKIEEIKQFIKQALQEQEERIKQEILQIVIEDVPHKYQERLLKEIKIETTDDCFNWIDDGKNDANINIIIK